MRISDWSSDVCSSDLHEMQRGLGEDAPVARPGRAATATGGFRMNHDNPDARFDAAMRQLHESAVDRVSGHPRPPLQERKSVVEGKRESGRVDLGGRRTIKKNNATPCTPTSTNDT